MYYENRVPDGNKDARKEDLYLRGPWFSYPIGIGYMLRCVLTYRFITAQTYV